MRVIDFIREKVDFCAKALKQAQKVNSREFQLIWGRVLYNITAILVQAEALGYKKGQEDDFADEDKIRRFYDLIHFIETEIYHAQKRFIVELNKNKASESAIWRITINELSDIRRKMDEEVVLFTVTSGKKK